MKEFLNVRSCCAIGLFAALVHGVCGCDRSGNTTSANAVFADAPAKPVADDTNSKPVSSPGKTIVQRALAAKKDLERKLDRLEIRTEEEDATAQDFYQLGETLRRMRQYAPPELKLSYDTDAVAAFEQAHALSGKKGFARALLGAANIHLRVNNLADGIRFLEKAATVDPKDIRVRAGIARLEAYRTGDWTATVETLEKLVVEPDGRHSPGLWHALGYAYKQAGRLTDAERAYRKKFELDPTQVGVWVNIGTVLASQGRSEEAIDAYNIMRAVDPTNGYATHNIAIQLVKTGDPNDARRAIALVEAMLEVEPGFPAAWGNLGQAYGIVGDCDKAVHAYEIAANATPMLVESWNNLGITHSKCGDFKRAVEAHLKARDIDPTNPRTLYDLGTAYARSGQHAEAVAMLQEAGVHNPDDARIWNNLGSSLMRQNQHKQALEAFKKAVSANPNHQSAHLNSALAYAAIGDPSGAITVTDKLLANFPPKPNVYCERATALFHMHDFSRAIDDCNNALQLDKEFAQAHWIKGVLRLAEGRHADAIKDFERALGDPNYAAYSIVYAWIAQAGKTPQGKPVVLPPWATGRKFRDPWESSIVAFANGEMDGESLWKSASNDEQRCEAAYYIAEQVRRTGNMESARMWYERCVRTGRTSFFEFRLAKWELDKKNP